MDTYSSGKYRADIDGLRAIAVLSVFLFHLQPQLLPGGFLGVDVFFVISGYLISGIILRENLQGTFSFGVFYARRIKRIFPALFVVLLLTAFIAVILLTPDTYTNFMKSARYAAAQVANFFFARDIGYFEEGFSAQPLLHTWSLGVEEQYYLFWPLLIYWAFRFIGRGAAPHPALHTADATSNTSIRSRIAAVFFTLLLVSYAACFHLAEHEPILAFYMFYTRAWEFCIGGLIALTLSPKILNKLMLNLIGMIGLLLLAYGFMFVEETFYGEPFLRLGVLIPVIGSALIIYSNQQTSWANKLLSTVFPVAIGRISYSLYLYHWPVIIFYKLYTNKDEIDLLASVFIIALAIGLATLSYYYVEQPARRSRITNKKVIAFALLAIMFFSFSFNALEKHDSASWRITAYANDLVNPDGYGPYDCRVSIEHELNVHECDLTGDANAPQVALVGDSHAPNYFQATLEWARTKGLNVVSLGAPGCPMLTGEIYIKNDLDPDQAPRCKNALSIFSERIVNNEAVKLVLLAQRFDLFYDGMSYHSMARQFYFTGEDGKPVSENHSNYYRDQLSRTIEELKKAGKEIVVLKQVPLFGSFNSCEWRPLINSVFSTARSCTYDESFIARWQRPSIDFIDQFASTHQLKTYDPFLSLERPFQNGSNLYKDIDHLNAHGYFALIPDFVTKMNEFDTTLIIQ